MAKKNVKKIVKKQSIKEFKAWLEGITEFQPDDWCPTPEQWNTIKNKINNLQDEIIVKEIAKESPAVQPSPPTSSQANQPKRIVPSLMNVEPTDETVQPLKVTHGITLLPTEDGAPPEVIDIPVPLDANGQPIIQTVSSKILATGKTYKTPSDLSGKPYKSSFA